MLHRIHQKPKQGTGIVKAQLVLDMQVADNCWICEGWTEVRFEFRPGVSFKFPDGVTSHDVHVPIHLHLELDDYKADLMLPEDPDEDPPTKYISHRRIPPGREQKFFFSIAGQQYIASDHPARKQEQRVEVTQSFGTNKGKVVDKGEDGELDVMGMPELNVIGERSQEYDPFTPERIKAMNVRPREVKRLGPQERGKSPWNFSTSAFRLYKPDSKQLLDQCFEVDWTAITTKVEYLIKDEKDRAELKRYLKSKYKMLRDAYKLTAGQDAQGNGMSIGKNAFAALMQACGELVDGKTLKLTDIDLGFIAVKAADAKKGNKQVPVDQLIRYNFLEVQIRLADQKFLKSGQCSTFTEAVSKMLDGYVLPIFASTDSHTWRKNHLWREECDLAVKRQYRTLQKLYD